MKRVFAVAACVGVLMIGGSVSYASPASIEPQEKVSQIIIETEPPISVGLQVGEEYALGYDYELYFGDESAVNYNGFYVSFSKAGSYTMRSFSKYVMFSVW